jgi:hypothetical protein
MNSLENEATNCERTVLALATGEVLNPAGERMLEKHLAGCADCRREAALYRQLQGQLSALPVPEPDEPKMQADFGAMLAGYQRAQGNASPSPLQWLRGWFETAWTSPLAGRLAFGLVMLLLGWGAGYWFSPRTGGPAPVAPVVSAAETGRQNMVLTLISQSSATDRLKAVGYTSELLQADERVIKALLFTLNHDENVNVRLVTVEALSRFAADPGVREGLVRSIAQQESPLVQIALADAMVALHEKRSVAPLREVLRRQGTDVYVKEKLESSIRVLL